MKLRGYASTTLALIAATAGLFAPAGARAAYNYPVTWSDMSDLDLKSVFRSPYASRGNLLEPVIPAGAMEVALRDADNRLSPEFRVPPALRAPVEFWLRIYTEWTTHHVAIFDSHHPEVVYDVLDFRSLSETARNPIVYEIVMKQRIKKKLAAFRRAFTELAKVEKREGRHSLNAENAKLSPEARQVLTAVARSKHKHRFSELAANLRTQTGQRDNIIKGLLRAEAFFPKMDKIFRDEGVPSELTRLALVESSFDTKARSRTEAAGVWQFMLAPGKVFMRIDRDGQIDERLSPLKSTVAAARMLKQNHRLFGNWALTVTSYNHGLKGLTKFRHLDDDDFTEIAPLFQTCNKNSRGGLGWAGRNYYAEFLAVLHAETYRNQFYNFYGEPPSSALDLRHVVFKTETDGRPAAKIALDEGVSITQFTNMNPDVRNLHRPLPSGFRYAVPGEADNFVALLERPPRVKRTLRASRKKPQLVSEVISTDR